MSTFNRYKTIAFLVFLFTSILMGCGHKSANNTKIDKKMNRPLARAVSIKKIKLGSGDVLKLSVWQNKDFDGSYKIDLKGNIFIPLVGKLKASGLSAHRLREEIILKLTDYIVDPQVQLTVTSYASRKVYVLGEVKNPGIYQMDDTLTTIVAALAAAGGFTDGASTNSVVHLKKGFDRGDARVLRMGSYLNNDHRHDGHLQNASLSGGDVIYVPASFMANVDNFFDHVAKIVYPVMEIERAVIFEPYAKDILDGKSINSKILVVP